MTIEELLKVIDSLEELIADPEISFGPSYEMVKMRKTEALQICRRELNGLKKKQNKQNKQRMLTKDTAYEFYVRSCEADNIIPMSYDKWKKSVRPQDENLEKKWENSKSAPSLWEKREKDPVYAASFRGTLGTAWGIGKPRGPKGS